MSKKNEGNANEVFIQMQSFDDVVHQIVVHLEVLLNMKIGQVILALQIDVIELEQVIYN